MDITTDFQFNLDEELDSLDKKDEFLKTYQKIALHYMKKDARGLLVYHQMGTGKTVLASSIAHHLSKHGYKTVLLSAKALHSNFEKNLRFYEEKIGETTKTKLDFITLNASTVYDKLRNVIEGSVLIVDEAHNLFNAITNGSKTMLKVYDMIMRITNIKLLFLTGSVLVNEPFELVPCFNMLKGFMAKENTLFPEIREYFNEEFVGSTYIKNKDKFQDRITGLVTYQGEAYNPSKKREGFPDVLPDKIIKPKMSEYQLELYQVAKLTEDQEKNDKVKNYERMSKPKGSSYSSYRIRTRQLCNFAFPPNITINGITEAHLKDMKMYGPKFVHIVENIEKYPKDLHLFYSFFVKGPGSGVMSKYLEFKGFKKYSKSSNDSKKCYAMINGDVHVDERDAIIKAFISEDNKNGKSIRVLLISETAIEGLDLKNIRHIYQLEPAWNFKVTDQLRARGVRLHSHDMLPPKDRNVQFYVYLMDLGGISTDEDMFRLSKKKEQTNTFFLHALMESSIDCKVFNRNDKITCRVCHPTGKKLYTDDYYIDIKIPSKCKQEEVVEAEEVIINGKIYYKYNNKLFELDESTGAYIPAKQQWLKHK